ncbi:hypothetical protein CF161_02656, partial [Pseudomonas sp. CF161]
MNIIDFNHSHPLQAYWQLAGAAVQADALTLALELDLFSALEQPLDVPTLAARLQLAPDNTGHWLELLWSMALLQRIDGPHGSRYGLSDTTHPPPLLAARAPGLCRRLALPAQGLAPDRCQPAPAPQ